MLIFTIIFIASISVVLYALKRIIDAEHYTRVIEKRNKIIN